MGIPLSVFGRKANLGEDTLDFFAAFVRRLVHMVDIQTLAVDPLRSQIAGEEADHRIHEGGNFLQKRGRCGFPQRPRKDGSYFAYSMARLSRMTLTLIWPG